jgi:ABC-type multidrug transport system fused ATPase/permease subunit
VNACALEADFEILPAKDETEIGEKGINLSGGQKQRVSLARALYQDSDIYLLDDPLSAVDAHVAQHLFEHVIGPNGMLSNKTRLLATHHISFLKDVHKIIVMKSGQIIGSGSYDQLYEKGLLSEEILNEKSDEDLEHENSDVTDDPLLNSQSLLNRQLSRLSESESITSQNKLKRQISRQISKQSDSTVKSESSKEKLAKEAKKAQLIDEEQQEFGNIKFIVYFEYLRKCGLPFIIVLVIAELLYDLCEVGANYWLNLWTSQNATLIGEPSNRNFYLSVYVSAILCEGIFIMLGTVAMYTGSIRAAAKLHKDMLFCILRTPLSFFDVTPMGRVINRFNRDMGTIDEDIPFSFMVTVQHWLWFPIIFIMIWSTNVFMGIQIIIVNVIFYAIYVRIKLSFRMTYSSINHLINVFRSQKLYLWTSRQLKRLESIARSPVYSHFNESISGAVSIRAYNVKQNFINDLQNRIDLNVNVSRHQFSTTMWSVVEKKRLVYF